MKLEILVYFKINIITSLTANVILRIVIAMLNCALIVFHFKNNYKKFCNVAVFKLDKSINIIAFQNQQNHKKHTIYVYEDILNGKVIKFLEQR